MKIAVPDTYLHVREFGHGKPVILVHGGTGTGEYDWRLLIPDLSLDFRLVTIDLRGHGGSPAPEWRLGIVRYGLDIQQVMRTLGIPRAAMIGFSGGANSLITLAARRPGLVTGLVLVGASMTSQPERIAAILTGPWPDELKDLKHEVGTGPDHWNHLRAALAQDWVINNSFEEAYIARITCPTLVVHGDRDRIVRPEQAAMLHAALPNSELWMAPGARHMVQLDLPGEFATQIRNFLDGLSW